MWTDFDKLAQISHPGEKGRGREDVVRDFLREYMPARFGIDTGFVVDVHGNVSGQMDIVVYDRASALLFKVSEGVRLFPIECVAAVIQVKSRLEKRDLEDAIANLSTAVALDRTGSGYPYMMLGGVMHPSAIHNSPGSENEDSTDGGEEAGQFAAKSEPILTAVFAFEGSGIAALAKVLKQNENLTSLEHRLPYVCVLDEGIISYVSGGSFAPFSAYYSGAWLGYIPSKDRGLNLRNFYVTLAWGAGRKVPLTPSPGRYAQLPKMEVIPAE